MSSKQSKISVREIALFGCLGALMFATKKIMEFIPNVHLLAPFIIAVTVCFRKKALYPIYAYVLIDGIFLGFAVGWIPYLYIWTILWGMTMLVPKNLPGKVKPFVYGAIGGLHGILFGTLYAPVQAIMYKYSLKVMFSWIIAGIPYDCIHAVSNIICSILFAVPLIKLLEFFKRKVA